MDTRLVSGVLAEENLLISAAEQANLIVMATHGSSGLQRLWQESITTNVARRTTMDFTTHKHTRHVRVPVEQEIRFWMRAPAITINLAAPLSEALAIMREHDVRRLPVVLDTGELRGIITHGDIRGADVLRASGLDPIDIADALRHIKVYEVMQEHPITVTPETSLREAALLMIENKIGGLPVVDDANMVVGIITESDLFEVLVQRLETWPSDV